MREGVALQHRIMVGNGMIIGSKVQRLTSIDVEGAFGGMYLNPMVCTAIWVVFLDMGPFVSGCKAMRGSSRGDGDGCGSRCARRLTRLVQYTTARDRGVAVD